MKKIVLALVVVAVFVFPSLAKATRANDNFNDNSMNTSLWTITADVEKDEAEGKMSFFEQNQRLEWITSSS